jgi:outer membrane immunogenic protein
MRLTATIPALAALMTLAATGVAGAQSLAAFPSGFNGFPSFAWAGPQTVDGKPRWDEKVPKWDGGYLSVSSGFSVTKFRHGPTVGGPEIGIATGRNWRDGNFIYGVELAGTFSPVTNRFSGGNTLFSDYNRDAAGIARLKAGVLLSDTVLVYSSVGAAAVHEKWRSGPLNAPWTVSRDETRFVPDVRAGVQWQPLPGLTLGVEVGASGGLR